MKILQAILLAVVVIVAILLLIPVFVKNEYAVKREIAIRKPRAEVFNYLKHLKNQNNYNKWVQMDPGMKKEYKGTDGSVGFVYAWEGEKAGKGEQEIKRILEGDQMDLELRFVKPFKSVGHTSFITRSVSADETMVSWGMEGRSPYPMNLMNLFIDKLLGKDLETSLNALKKVLEEK
jgi:hypothetical protein